MMVWLYSSKPEAAQLLARRMPSAVKQLMDQMIELLTEKEAAAVMRISPRSLAEIRKTGGVTFLRIGRSVRYRSEHILDFLAVCEVQVRETPTARYGYRSVGVHSDSNYQALADIA